MPSSSLASGSLGSRPAERAAVRGGADDVADGGTRVALDVVCGKWVVSVLAELAGEPRRYTELQARLPAVAGSMLTRTLRRMERDGIIAREVQAAIPPRVDYRLTELGETLREPLTALSRWAERHVADVNGARRLYDRRDVT